MMAKVYSKSHIQTSTAFKAQAKVILFERLVPLLKQSSSPLLAPNGIDTHSIFLATSVDFISAYVCGLRNGTNFIQNKGYREHWLQLCKSRSEHRYWPHEKSGVAALLQKYCLWLYPSAVDHASAELAAWNLDLCKKALKSIPETKIGGSDEAVVLAALNCKMKKEVTGDLEVASELFKHVLSGHEVTGVALTYLSWHLSRRPTLQDQLRKELLALQPNMRTQDDGPGQLPDLEQLDSLPILHAIVMETLRLHAPVPGPQPRRTPYPSSRIGDHEVPGGVRIAALAYSLHRDRRVFEDSDKWDHTRWLAPVCTDEELRERHHQFWTLGSGSRMGLASDFAMNGKSQVQH